MSNDYLMRQIEDMARFFASVVFMKRPKAHDLVDEEGSISQGGLLWYKLKELLAEGRVNAAENLLFETAEADPQEEYLTVAADFYTELGRWPDEKLKAAAFTRGELVEGLRAMGKLYGIQVDAPDDV